MPRKSSRATGGPSIGKLEQDVDAILTSHGLELDASVEKVLNKTRATPKPFRPKRRPAKSKRLGK